MRLNSPIKAIESIEIRGLTRIESINVAKVATSNRRIYFLDNRGRVFTEGARNCYLLDYTGGHVRALHKLGLISKEALAVHLDWLEDKHANEDRVDDSKAAERLLAKIVPKHDAADVYRAIEAYGQRRVNKELRARIDAINAGK